MSPFVGVLHVDLWMPENRSLKDRRRIVRSSLDRMRARHNVAVAEVSTSDDPRSASMAFACVGAHQHLLRETLEAVLRQLEGDLPTEIQSAEIEIR